MYRVTKKADAQRKKIAAMNRSKAAARMSRPVQDYPPELPDLRREIIIIDHDFGERIHRLMLYRTDRIDCYRVVADGKPWKGRIGWSQILAGIRKSLPRVGVTLE